MNHNISLICMMPLIRVQSKLYGSFIIHMTYNISILVTYSQTHNPCSNVIIVLHGSIQGSNPKFILPKIPVKTTMKDSKFISLSWFQGDKVITSQLNTLSSWDRISKLTYSFIWTFLNGFSSEERNIRKTIKIIFMLRIRKVLGSYIMSLLYFLIN
jgi:hypothetical protein